MKRGRLQCKDVPDEPILRFLVAQTGIWCNWYEIGDWNNPNGVRHAMPKDVPGHVALRKMQRLIGRGLVDGCACGCRGDFEITVKGRQYLAAIDAARKIPA